MVDAAKRADFGAVVIGAGFSGMYMLYRLREELGISARVYEAGDGVGGTWYWNRYPVRAATPKATSTATPSRRSCFRSGTGAANTRSSQRSSRTSTTSRIASTCAATFSSTAALPARSSARRTTCGEIETDQGDRVTAQYLITGIGCISTGQVPDIEGLDSFEGQWYHTGDWPHEASTSRASAWASLAPGSSGIQAIPVIAKQAGHLTVFQRTAQYTIPSRPETVDREFLDGVKDNYDEIWEKARTSGGGIPVDASEVSALEVSAEERQATYEAAGPRVASSSCSVPTMTSPPTGGPTTPPPSSSAPRSAEELNDPETADILVPTDHPFASKRALIDTNYFETYNRDNVDLVDIRHSPIREITPRGCAPMTRSTSWTSSSSPPASTAMTARSSRSTSAAETTWR